MFDGHLQVLFYAQSPKFPPFLRIWRAHSASGVRRIKNLNKSKCHKNLILWGVPSTKITPILTFNFHPPGTPGGLGVRRIKKWQKTKSEERLILGRVTFIKKMEIPKFCSAPRSAPTSGPVFSGCGPKIKIELATFGPPRCPNSEKVQHDPLPQKPWRR